MPFEYLRSNAAFAMVGRADASARPSGIANLGAEARAFHCRRLAVSASQCGGDRAMIFDWLLGLFSNDLAIDLGTANTLIYVKGKGIVCNEPSVVAVQTDARGGKQGARRRRAKPRRCSAARPGNIEAIRPLKDGVIADFEITEAMLRYFIADARTTGSTLVKPRIIICVPFGITEVEKRAVQESRRVRRRARGLPDRGADGGGDRRRAADHRADRQHDRRHRRRHHRGRGHLARRHRLLASRCASAATRWTRRSSSTSSASTTC